MNEVYIKTSDLGKFTESLFKEKLGYNNVDIISILDLIGTIEDLCGEIDKLNEEIEDLKDYIKGEDNRDPRDYNDSYME